MELDQIKAAVVDHLPDGSRRFVDKDADGLYKRWNSPDDLTRRLRCNPPGAGGEAVQASVKLVTPQIFNFTLCI